MGISGILFRKFEVLPKELYGRANRLPEMSVDYRYGIREEGYVRCAGPIDACFAKVVYNNRPYRVADPG